jgi:hypothetical protein
MSLEERRNDPLVRFLDSAPFDDEPETDEERAAVAQVEADRAGGVARVSFAEIKRAYGDGRSTKDAGRRRSGALCG